MSLFEVNADIASNLPRSLGAPKSMRQHFATSFELAKIADRTLGKEWAVQDEYQSLSDEAFKRTGVRLNPMPTMDQDDEEFRRVRADSVQEQEATDRAIFLARLQALRESNPGALDDLPVDHAGVEQRVMTRAQALQAERQMDLTRDPSAGAAFGDFLGSASAMMLDPPLLTTLVLGAPRGASILGGMAKEAMLGAGSEAVLQVPIQQNRAELGLENGFAQAVTNVATVGLASPAFYGLFRAAGVGIGAAKKMLEKRANGEPLSTDERLLLETVEELQNAVENVPVSEATPPEMRAYLRNVDQALLDVESGKLANVSRLKTDDLPANMITATELRTVLINEAKELGIDISEEVSPGLARAISMTSDRFQAALSKSRLTDLTARMEKAAANEVSVLERGIANETKLGEATMQRAQIEARVATLEAAARGEQGAIDELYSGAFGDRPSLEALDALINNPQFVYKGAKKAVNKRTADIRKRLDEDRAALSRLNDEIKAGQSERRLLADEMAKVQKAKVKAGKQLSARVDSVFSDAELERVAQERDRAKHSGTMYYPLSDAPTPRETASIELSDAAEESLVRLEEKGEAIADATIEAIREPKNMEAVTDNKELKEAVNTILEELDAEESFANELAACIVGGATDA